MPPLVTGLAFLSPRLLSATRIDAAAMPTALMPRRLVTVAGFLPVSFSPFGAIPRTGTAVPVTIAAALATTAILSTPPRGLSIKSHGCNSPKATPRTQPQPGLHESGLGTGRLVSCISAAITGKAARLGGCTPYVGDSWRGGKSGENGCSPALFSAGEHVLWLWLFGGVLLSHTLACAVPSALKGLTSGFGMGPGVSLFAMTTVTNRQPRSSVLLLPLPFLGWGWCVSWDTL